MNVGIDIGGTFTDIILLDDAGKRIKAGKILTTPDDPSVGALEGLRALLSETEIRPERLEKIIHGTTLVANALIERRGAKTGLIVTKGFRDILEIGREKRYDVYDIFLEMPKPLVPRIWRKEVAERLSADGRVIISLNLEEAARAVDQLREEGIEAIAVCFLHSFRNAEHELLMERIISERAPEMFVSLSHQVIPEIREYERTCTTAANAYTQPLMTRYLHRIEDRLARLGFKGKFFVMLSSGGTAHPDTARRFPVRIVESGPAAGAIAASFFGHLAGEKRLLSFDMGGTTAKTCLIEEGEPRLTTDFEVAKVYRFKKGSGLPIRLPVIEMIEIGAGGGSIAHLDSMGLLKVGPQSAGAYPGPACYGLSGQEPTVTDADLLLGYLDADFFLGGKMALDKAKAEKSINEIIARPLGLDLVQAAWGIHQVVNENMANAARIHVVEKGEDATSYSMVAFGGAGPVHAHGLCQRLGIKKIICPLRAGVISALGFLIAPLSFDMVRSYVCRLDMLVPQLVNKIFREMEQQGMGLLKDAGVEKDQVLSIRTADMRYQGQGHEIVVPIPGGEFASQHLELIQEYFDIHYKRLYHRTIPNTPVEALNWRVTLQGPRPKINLRMDQPGRLEPSAALKGTRPVYFSQVGEFVSTKVYDRTRLLQGAKFSGPAVVEERESTLVMGPATSAVIDDYLNLLVTLE